MVTQQEFIQGLLEPLMTGMKPLALADAPGAVVRGVASGQPFSEAFSSVMSDPLSMEGRVYGEDVTGDPYSGMIFELLSDPAALAGLGAAGLGGVGMALGRRYARGAGSEAAEGVLERLMREGRSVDEALDLLWQGTNAEQALAQELEMGLARESAEGTAGRRFAPTTDPYSEEKNRIMAEAVEAGPGEDLPTTSYRLVDELMRLVEEDPARFLTREDIYSPEDLSGVMSEKQINRLRSKPSAQIEQGLFLPPGGAEEGQFIRSNLIKELLGGRGQAGIDDPLGPATAEVRELLMPHLKQLYESGAIPQEGIPISRLSRGYSDPLPEYSYQYYKMADDDPFPTSRGARGSMGRPKYAYYPFAPDETFPLGARELVTQRSLGPGEEGFSVRGEHGNWPDPTDPMIFASEQRAGELPVMHGGDAERSLHLTELQIGEKSKSDDPHYQRGILTQLYQAGQDSDISGISHSGAREIKMSVGFDPQQGRQLYGEVSPSGEIGGEVGNTIDELQHIVDVYEGNISDRELMAMQASGEAPDFSTLTETVARQHDVDLQAMHPPEPGMPEPVGGYDLTLDEVLEGVEPGDIQGLKEEIRKLTAGAETGSHSGKIERYIRRVTGVEPVEVYPSSAVQQQGYGDPVKYYPLRTESGEWASPKVAALMEKLLKGGVPIVPGIIPLMMLQEREGSRYGS